jgi:hypothetical protein
MRAPPGIGISPSSFDWMSCTVSPSAFERGVVAQALNPKEMVMMELMSSLFMMGFLKCHFLQ